MKALGGGEAPSSSPAQDTWFSAMGQGFESPWGYQTLPGARLLPKGGGRASGPFLNPAPALGSLGAGFFF